jgi:serine/threonine protein kinase/WD40 repeat protein
MTESTEFSIGSGLAEARARQLQQWSGGEQITVEELLQEFPQLASDHDSILELLYAEYCLRLDRNEPTEPDEYFDRFPQLADRLRVIFQMHQAMDDATASPTSVWNLDDTQRIQLALRQNKDGGDDTPTFAAGITSFLPLQAAMTLELDDYELTDVIGHGGMGIVYKAKQTSANRMVAVKMIRSAQLASKDELRRFQREIEAAAGLDHPNIVPIYQVGEANGQPYFSMALVNGPTLASRASVSPLETDEAVSIVRDASNAIHYAHEKGIIHRDLKPANLMLTHKGELKITDFGLAKHVDREEDHTATGSVLGTPSYMAPEQASGENNRIGAATDVYSLGAILYFLLTGRPPFQSANVIDTILQVLNDEPVSVRQLNPTIPRDLETVVLKCLHKDPAKRYDTAEQLSQELDRVLNHVPVLARPVSTTERAWRWCRRNRTTATLITTSTVLLLALLVISAIDYSRQIDLKNQANQSRITAEVNEARVTGEKERADSNAIQARANSKLAQQQRELAEQRLYVVSMTQAHAAWNSANIRRQQELLNRYLPAAGEPDRRLFEWHYLLRLGKGYSMQIPFAGPTWDACYSPDGKLLAAAGTGETSVGIWDASSGELLHELQTPSGATDLSFNPEGGQLAAACPDGSVFIWDPQTGIELLRIATPESPDHVTEMASLAYDPTGKQLVTARRGNNQISIWSTTNGELLTTFAAGNSDIHSVTLNHDSTLLVAAVGSTVELWNILTRYHITLRKPTSSEHKRTDEIEHRSIRLIDSPTFYNDVNINERGLVSAVRSDGWTDYFGRPVGGKWQALLSSRVHLDAINAESHSSIGSAATASDDQTIRLQTKPANHFAIDTFILRGHFGPVTNVAFDPSGTWLASTTSLVGEDEFIKVWDARGQAEFHISIDQSRALGPVEIANQGGWLTAATWDDDRNNNSRLAFYKISSQLPSEDNLLFEIPPQGDNSGAIELLQLSSNEQLLAASYATGSLQLIDVESRETIKTWNDSVTACLCLTFRADDQQLIACERDGTLRIYNLSTDMAAVLPNTWKPEGVILQAASFNSDGSRVAAALDNGILLTVEVETGKVLGQWDEFVGTCHALAFSEGDHSLVVGIDNVLHLLDSDNLQTQQRFDGHKGNILDVVFSADGRRLFSASDDTTLMAWDVALGQELLTLDAHMAAVKTVRVSDDGHWLISASVDGTVRLWDGRP